jgi:hypothetical protein
MPEPAQMAAMPHVGPFDAILMDFEMPRVHSKAARAGLHRAMSKAITK